MINKKKPILNWEYCECGCHCLEATIGGITFSDFISWEELPPGQKTLAGNTYDYNKPKYRISVSGYKVLGTFTSTEAVEARILEYLDSLHLEEKLKNDLKTLKALRKSVNKEK